MIYLQLFLSFLQIGALSFGGGYTAMPLIRSQIVSRHGWLSMGEFTDLITVLQMMPGPIAVNSTILVGIKIAGVPGVVMAMIEYTLPPCTIMTPLAELYLKYRNVVVLQGILNFLRPVVISMIASTGIPVLTSTLWGSDAPIRLSSTGWGLIVIFGICVALLQKMKMNSILVMVLAGILNVGVSWVGIGG